MQGQRSIFDPYSETVDLNLGSNSNMDESDDWNMLSPIERRLLNNDLSSEINFSCVNNSNNHHNHNFRNFSYWDVGESSSRASLQGHVSNDGLKINQLESSSSTIRHPRENFIAGPSNTQSSVSNHIPMNVNLNIGYDGTSDDDDDDMGFMDFYKSGRSELQSSGLSCKRKALEGTSVHPTGSGSSFFPQASRSLNISPPLLNPVPIFRHESPNARVSENSSHTHIGLRGSIPYNNISSTGNNPTRRPNTNSSPSNQSSNRQFLLNEFLDQTSRGQPIVPPVNSSNFLNQQPPLMHVPSMPRNAPQFPWGSNIGSRTGGGGSSSLLRNNVQYHNFVPPSDSRNLAQDPTYWSLSTGNSGAPSSSRNGTRPFNALWPHQHNPTMPSQPYEFPPWTLFPPAAELESGGQRGHFPSFPIPASSSSSTSEDNRISAGVPSQRHHYQPFSRNGLLMEVPSEDWRALATDIEGRQRLVSEVCTPYFSIILIIYFYYNY